MQTLNSKFNFIKYLIALCVLLCTHGVFAYGDEDYDRRDKTTSSEDIENLQESIETLNQEIKKNGGQATNIVAMPTQVPALKNGKADPEMMRRAIKMINAQFKNVPDAQVAQMIRENATQNPIMQFFVNSDKLVNFAVGIVKDDKALLYLFELTQDKDVLKFALGVVIFLFIVSFFLKRAFIKKDEFFVFRYVKSLIFFVFSTGLKAGVLYFIYKDYLDPSVDVFIKRVL
ncbi:hypothetical protein M902_2491 [Bacteriovorax sp. BAL6_X]|uniref:FlxA-like family protein n=1 Tax=Bacteriovorax sp. BAL6_X TaxID=1201290 RepID=UPI0003866B96|nr:FlxA-like family protein [Bacteriovorax sp. BAL6_X]EPZ50992.1 hypothetical protein M902_2491 [Bacteriovorax sp. BAL6_X]